MSTQNRDSGRAERAAAVRAEQARKERNRRIALIAGIVVILGAIVAAGAWYTGGSGNAPVADSKVSAAAGAGSVVVGPSSAPTKVVVYEDFQCPYCRQLEDATRDFLRENAAAGKVQVTYHPIDLLKSVYGERGMNAFAAVLAHSTPEAALKLHDLLYENQPYETASDSVTPDQILGFVQKAGGGNADVAAALRTTDTAFFQAAADVMVQEKITSTPTVLINGKAVSGGVADIVKAIEQAVG